MDAVGQGFFFFFYWHPFTWKPHYALFGFGLGYFELDIFVLVAIEQVRVSSK